MKKSTIGAEKKMPKSEDQRPLIPILGCLDVISRRFFFAFSKKGHVPIRAAMLYWLYANGGTATQLQLCEYLYRTPSSISSLSRNLETEGLVKREQNPEDRKYKQVTLTKKGEKLARKLNIIAEEILQDIFSPLSEKDIQMVLKKLGLVVRDQVAKHGRRMGWYSRKK